MRNKGKKFPAEILNRSEVQQLLGSFAKTATGTRNKALILLYLRSCLRCNEAIELRMTDIDHERLSVFIRQGKGGKSRVIGIDKATSIAIQQWISRRGVNSEYVFCTHKGDRLDNSYVRRMVKRNARASGISRRVHVHGLRHTGACQLMEEGFDLRLIQKQLGHSSLAVTDRYLNHLNPQDLLEAFQTRESL